MPNPPRRCPRRAEAAIRNAAAAGSARRGATAARRDDAGARGRGEPARPGAKRGRGAPGALRALPVLVALIALSGLFAPGRPAEAADFVVFSQLDDPADAPDGSLRRAIDDLIAGGSVDENFIRFDLPTTQPVLLDDALADIDRNVEILPDEIFGGLVRKSDPDADFDILRIATGTTTIDGVRFEGGPITVGIDTTGGADPTDAMDARLGFRYGPDVSVEFDQAIQGLGGVVKEGAGELILSGENTFEAGLLVKEGTVVVDAVSVLLDPGSLPGDAEVEADALLVFSNFDRDPETDDQITDEDYAFEVSGEGRVRKIGSHDLLLSGGGFQHTGGTEILEGSITATPTAFPGDAEIGPDANLVLDVAVDEAWAGSASGQGAVDKQGAGTLTLDAKQTNAGGIFVGDGGVRARAGNLPPRVELAATTVLELDQPSNGTYAGRITGDGDVEKHGAGTLLLAGSNDYAGGTTVLQGRLRGGLGAIPGDVLVDATLDGTSTLELIVDQDGTYGGTLSGDGAFVKSGSARLVFDTPQALTGASTIESGTLEVTSTGTIDGSVGGITVARGGTLTGEGQAVGAIDVQGRLRPGRGLDTTFDALGDVTLAPTSTLAVQVQHDGGLDRRTTLDVGGTTTIDGGTLDVQVGAGDYQTVRVFPVVTSGVLVESTPFTVAPLYAFVDVTATPNGGDLEVSVVENGANAVTYAQTRNQVEVATAIDALIANDTLDPTVRESLVTVTIADLPDVLDDMGAASLSVMFTQRLESARRFSRAVGRRFTAGRYEDSPPVPERRPPTPRPRPAAEAATPPPPPRKPVDRLHGPYRGSSPPAPAPAPPPAGTSAGDAAATSQPAPETSSEPESSPPATSSEPAPSTPATSSEPAPSTPPVDAGPERRADPRRGTYRDPVGADGGVGIWGDAFGVFGRIDGGVESEDVKTRVYGGTLGLDYRLPEGSLLPEGHGLRLGGAFDYGRAAPFGERGRTGTTANLFLVGAHASWTYGPLYAGVVGHYGYMDADSERRIVFGDVDDTATGAFDGQEGGVYTEAGARIGVGRRMLVQPWAGFEWTRLSQSGFDETGAPGLDLSVDSASIDSLRASVGASLAMQMTLRDRFGIEPELRVGWGIELGDTARLIEASLSGERFSSIGAETSRNEALLGAGYTMRVSPGAAIALDYDARIGDKQSSHALTASFYTQW